MREALAGLGPYFALARPDDSWQPLGLLLTSPAALAVRVEAVRAALGGEAVPVRIAVSVAQLGLVARLLAPVFGAAVLDGRLLDLDQACWQPGVGGPMPMALSDEALAGVPYESLAAGLDRVLRGPVHDLVELAAGMSVSRRLLWGNVASGINGAATMVALARPELAPRARELGADLLRLPTLLGSGTGTIARDFRRRSCCLLYRLGDGRTAVCADCVLRRV